MNINLHIEASDPMELQQAIANLAAGLNPHTTDQPATTRKRSAKVKQEEKSADPVPEEKPTEKEEKPAEKEVPVKEEPIGEDRIPSDVELRAIAAEKGHTPEGKAAVKGLLNKYGSPAISKVPDDKRMAFLADLEAL